MNYEEMKQSLRDIELIEQDIMRPLTEEEKNLAVKEGWRSLLNELHLGDYNYKMLKEMKKVLTILFTKPDQEYYDLVKTLDPAVGEAFRQIGDDILGPECGEIYESDPDPVQEAIERLKDGKVLELDEELQEEVIDWLWEHEDNVRIEVRNGKIRLR